MPCKGRIKVPPGKVLIFRYYRRDPKTGRLLPPPPGCKAWPILIDAEEYEKEKAAKRKRDRKKK